MSLCKFSPAQETGDVLTDPEKLLANSLDDRGNDGDRESRRNQQESADNDLLRPGSLRVRGDGFPGHHENSVSTIWHLSTPPWVRFSTNIMLDLDTYVKPTSTCLYFSDF